MSDTPFFDQLAPEAVIVVSINILRDPDLLDAVYHTEDGAITMLCALDEDGSDRDAYRAIKARDVTRAFAKTRSLMTLPINHVAEYEDGVWEIDSLTEDMG